jgi:hypothetical protein
VEQGSAMYQGVGILEEYGSGHFTWSRGPSGPEGQGSEGQRSWLGMNMVKSLGLQPERWESQQSMDPVIPHGARAQQGLSGWGLERQ